MSDTARRAQAFWSYVDKNYDGHWYWCGDIDARTGYAITYLFPTMTSMAHRISYWLMKNRIPTLLSNTCGKHNCVNPEHWNEQLDIAMFTTSYGAEL